MRTIQEQKIKRVEVMSKEFKENLLRSPGRFTLDAIGIISFFALMYVSLNLPGMF